MQERLSWKDRRDMNVLGLIQKGRHLPRDIVKDVCHDIDGDRRILFNTWISTSHLISKHTIRLTLSVVTEVHF